MSAAPSGLPQRRVVTRPRLTWHRAYTSGCLVAALFVFYLTRTGWTFGGIEALGITNDALPLALAAVGETFVILTNGIDLSIGSMITVCNVTLAVLDTHGFGGFAVVLVLGIGAVAGLLNGLIVCYMRIAPLIATLATSSIYLGIALYILPSPGGTVPQWLINWTTGDIGSSNFPIAGLWLVLAMAAGWAVLRRTNFGVRLQALGGSESSSFSAGISVVRVRVLAYVAAGVCSALAGIVLGGLTESGDPTIGAVYLLGAVAAVVVGGTSLAGGVGTIAGSVLGAVVLSLVSAVLLVSGISANYQYIVTGAIVIGALLAHSLQSKLGGVAAERSRRFSRDPPAEP
ncbi:MAG TPA: ABC transporter permease [Solirubrobacteraceae bacterium]|jgi:ribose transport system permease protein|nr:ABC transporter permease [Solirubrobacteraceae bacterium]